jgi:hypothetical protein
LFWRAYNGAAVYRLQLRLDFCRSSAAVESHPFLSFSPTFPEFLIS